MVGTLPRTRYLLTKYDMVKGEFDTKPEIARHIGIFIDAKGHIYFQKRKMPMSYLLSDDDPNGFTPREAIDDWAYTTMDRYLFNGYRIYRFLTEG